MDRVIIGVIFCGNCNPDIDAPGLLSEIEARFAGVRFAGWREPGIRALLVLNGCRTACAAVPDFEGPVITVAGRTIRRVEVAPGTLADRLAAEILETNIF